MKVIFLDNDGVICLSNNWGGRSKKWAKYRSENPNGSQFKPDAPVFVRFDDFDTKAVKVLNSVLEETGAEIVVSSDWRYHASLEELGDYYESQGIIKRPIGITSKTQDIDPIIWQWVQEILLNPTRLHEAWKLHEQQQLNELKPLLNMIETNKAKLSELLEEKRRLIKAYTAGTLTLDDLGEEKTRIEKQIADLTQAIAELQADIQPRTPTVKEFETIESYAQEIREGANLTSDDPAEQRKIYNTLQMEITLTYESKEGKSEEEQHWAEFRCILGRDRLSTTYTTHRRSETAPTNPTAAAI